MDVAKMERKLTEYLTKLDAYIAGGPSGGWWPDNEARRELTQLEPTVKVILGALDPKLDFDFEDWGGTAGARKAVLRALGILKDRDEWEQMLAPAAPAFLADQLHPWIWKAAASLWESKHYRAAVQTAATALNGHTQKKLNFRGLSDTKLMNAALGANPKPGQSQLVVDTTGMSGDTANGMQVGVMQLAAGAFLAIRNPATHESTTEWDEQYALECLATLSVVARFIDGATVQP